MECRDNCSPSLLKKKKKNLQSFTFFPLIFVARTMSVKVIALSVAPFVGGRLSGKRQIPKTGKIKSRIAA